MLVQHTSSGRTYTVTPTVYPVYLPAGNPVTLGRGLRSVGEVPPMAGRGDKMAAGAAGRGPMRASHADREQVIEALKDAFAHGRLTKDELDARAGRALAGR